MIVINSIKIYREKAKMSQAELASQMGITQQSVANWECGKSYPSCEKLPELARALNCSIDELFSDDTTTEYKKEA